MLEYDVEYRFFFKKVLECLFVEGYDWKVLIKLDDFEVVLKDLLLIKRKDFRDKFICSIDFLGCVDIDDVLYAKKFLNGNWEVGVYIVDVIYFVKSGIVLDAEGVVRGIFVYLVDKRIDMLFMFLGIDLCFLKLYVDRFVFFVIWELDDSVNIVNVNFMKFVIRFREVFLYE